MASENERTTASAAARADQLFRAAIKARALWTDRFLAALLLAQLAGAVMLAAVPAMGAIIGTRAATAANLASSTGGPSAATRVLHALLWGGLLDLIPVVLAFARPGRFYTRCALAVAQVIWPELIARITGLGEPHLLIFAGLAVLALYRDACIVLTAAIASALIHFASGPEEGIAILQVPLWLGVETVFLNLNLGRSLVEMRTSGERAAQMEAAQTEIDGRVLERTAELDAAQARYKMLLEGTSSVFWEMDLSTQAITYMSPQVERVLGWPVECFFEEKSFANELCHPDDRETFFSVGQQLQVNQEVQVEYRARRSDGRYINVRTTILLSEVKGKMILRGTTRDITEQREMEVELRQAQKLESVGRLAAGVAHQINNPVQFVADSVHFVREGVDDLLRLVEASRALEEQVRDDRATPQAADELAGLRKEIDVEYLKHELPEAADRATNGLGRVAAIVRSMKEFARPDEKEMGPVDLNSAIKNTLTIADNEYRYVAEVQTNLREIPPVICHAGDVNQVILELVINAAQAIGEVVRKSGDKGVIRIDTRRDGEGAMVSIQDTGAGIPETIRARIFEPFFSTKGVGKGSGQGLAHARAVVQEQHGGRLTFKSEVGRGTSFFLWLPLSGKRLTARTGT